MGVVKMNEVTDFINNYKSESKLLIEKLLSSRSSTNSIVSMNSFEGKGASSVKNYLTNVHVKSSRGYQDILSQIENSLDHTKNDFLSSVDNDGSCIIKSDYVEEIVDKISNEKNNISSSIKTINSELNSINDISNVSKISLTDLNNDYSEFKKIVTTMLEKFNSFQSTQNNSLANLEESLSLIKNIQSEMAKISSTSAGISNYDKNSFDNLIRRYNELNGIIKKPKKILKEGLKLTKVGYLYGAGHIKIVKDAKGRIKYILVNKKNTSKIGKMFIQKLMKDSGLKKFNSRSTHRVLTNIKGTKTSKLFSKLSYTGGDPQFLNRVKGFKNKASSIGSVIKNKVKDNFPSIKKAKDWGTSFKEASKWGKTAKIGGGVLSVASTGLMAYDNYNNARDSGLSKKEATVASTVNTGIDLAVVGVTTKVGMAIGTAIPIPGVGTAVGAVAGFAIGMGLSYAGSTVTKPAVDFVKNKVNSAVKGASNALKSFGKWAFG
ncbi:hypothetical protein GIX45_17785 [Erwinia sp. CPCC 100877]|nr:hypothetical protein [Erwinia sp. CPCC 100877]